MLYGMLNRSAVSFNPDKDIPPLDGKVILITGSTTSTALYFFLPTNFYQQATSV
jgi:hypothetical protein